MVISAVMRPLCLCRRTFVQSANALRLTARTHPVRDRLRHTRKIGISCVTRASRTEGEKEQLLQHLLVLSVTDLKQHIDEHGDTFSMSFFEWLASREDQLDGRNKVELGVLAGQIMAIKEGLEPLGFDQVAEELQEHWEAAQLLQSLPADQTNAGTSSEASTSTGPGSNSSSGEYGAGPTSSDQALAQINPAQSSFQLMQPFSDAGIAQNAEKVRLLNLDVKQARANSTVQIIGRKELSANSFPEGPQTISNAAHRILEYLLQLHSAELRREVLPDAFESQPEASQQGYEESSEGHKGDNEQLSTTPLQLLQAIDLEISRLSQGTSGIMQGQNLLPGGNPTTVDSVKDALQQLRKDVLDCWHD